MKLNEDINKQIEDIFNNTDDNIHSVGLGYKYVNNIKTEEISLVFGVSEKKQLNDIPKDSIIPKQIKLGDNIINTDVIQQEKFKLVACYSDGDYEIQKLRTLQLPLSAFRGGQEIRQYPTKYTTDGIYDYFSVGTLGFFAKDNIDGKVVGVTNNHVACFRKLYANERFSFTEEKNYPYNTIESRYWKDDNLYDPGALTQTSGYLIQSGLYIKRYEPVSLVNTNYADVALLIVPPSYIDNNSYRMWQPSNNNTYPSSLPFATTAEINNLLVTNPKVYSTGRTTGPKGYNNTATCNLKIAGVGLTMLVSDQDGTTPTWGDCITYEYEDKSANPAAGGDSGSCVIAEIGGVQKIIGICFAAGNNIAVANRIDRIVSAMNISAFTIPFDASIPTKTSITTSDMSKYGDKKTIVINGKTYYQSGLTYSTSYSSIT